MNVSSSNTYARSTHTFKQTRWTYFIQFMIWLVTFQYKQWEVNLLYIDGFVDLNNGARIKF